MQLIIIGLHARFFFLLISNSIGLILYLSISTAVDDV